MLYQKGCPAIFQEDCGTIPGNSQRCITGYKFPRRRQRRSWRLGITPDAGIGVVLEAWCYTRADGPEVVHVAATGFRGIPELCSSVQIPQTMVTVRSILTAARGVDTRVAWVTASTGSQVFKVHTGLLTFFVYTLSILVSVYTVT